MAAPAAPPIDPGVPKREAPGDGAGAGAGAGRYGMLGAGRQPGFPPPAEGGCDGAGAGAGLLPCQPGAGLVVFPGAGCGMARPAVPPGDGPGDGMLPCHTEPPVAGAGAGVGAGAPGVPRQPPDGCAGCACAGAVGVPRQPPLA
jgi:hypothetical protein